MLLYTIFLLFSATTGMRTEVIGVQPDPLLTVQEVARRLAVNPETVRRWLRAGRLKGFSLGSDKAGWRIDAGDLDLFVNGLATASRTRVQRSEERPDG